MDARKVIQDCILTTDDAIYLLRMWKGLLEQGQTAGGSEPADYQALRQQLQETGLWSWVREAAGHGESALEKAVGIGEANYEASHFVSGSDRSLR